MRRRTVLLRSASMAPTSAQWNTLLTWVASSTMMPQSARTLTTTCPKPAVPLEDCQRVWTTHLLRLSMKIQVYRAIVVPTLLYGAETCVLYTGSRSGYLRGFINAACTPSLASNGKTTCQMKKFSREPACPARSPSSFRCSCTGLFVSQRWKPCTCLQNSC